MPLKVPAKGPRKIRKFLEDLVDTVEKQKPLPGYGITTRDNPDGTMIVLKNDLKDIQTVYVTVSEDGDLRLYEATMNLTLVRPIDTDAELGEA